MKKGTAIICDGNEITVKYDFAKNTHLVYFGINNSVRRIIVPTHAEAMRIVNDLSLYKKVSVK